MLNFLWAGMLLTGLVYGAATGRIAEVNAALITSAKEAVTLCITMLGVMSFWTGLMAVARSAGVIRALSRLLRPVIRYLFPGVPKGHPAEEYIISNITANILGLGWAATPFGLKAMKELKSLEEERARGQTAEQDRTQGKQGGSEKQSGYDRKNEKSFYDKEEIEKGNEYVPKNKRVLGKESRVAPGRASDEMCAFLIINISSLQLIPVNVIAYRSQYGSANPTGIIGVSIAVTLFSTLVAVVFCKVMQKR